MVQQQQPGPGRPVNHQAREQRRQQILAAARRCFMEKGFHAASTADISREAGVSVANLYQYFPSKQELVLAIAEQDLESDLALGSEFTRGRSVFEALEAIFAALLEQAEHDQTFRLRFEIFAEAVRNPDMLAALAAIDGRLARALSRALERAQQRGELDPELDPAVLACLILRITDGLFLGAGAGLMDGKAVIPQLGRLLRQGLSPDRSSR
jgi:TetR/AcrR family transcriptional repressor of uid operon